MPEAVETKSKRKKGMSLYEYYDRKLLVDSDTYLLSIQEASQRMRMDRNKFVNDYIKTGKIKVIQLEDESIKIRVADLREYQDQQSRIYFGG